MKAIYSILVAILICTALSATETEEKVLFPDHHLCLEASGKVVLKADKAVFSFSAKGLGSNLRSAVTNAQANVEELTASLVRIGIERNCFSTGSFTSGKNKSSYFLTDKKDYVATLYTIVTLRDLSKLDEAILILTDKKAENLSGISYSLDDPSAARQRAREMALNRIVEQRETISRIMNIQITDVQLIDEAPFEALPWNTGVYNYSNTMNSVIQGVRSNEINFEMDDAESSGGFYSPEVTVETQVRVIYRIGLSPSK